MFAGQRGLADAASGAVSAEGDKEEALPLHDEPAVDGRVQPAEPLPQEEGVCQANRHLELLPRGYGESRRGRVCVGVVWYHIQWTSLCCSQNWNHRWRIFETRGGAFPLLAVQFKEK